MQQKAQQDMLDPKKEKVSSAVAFIKQYKSVEKYLDFQVEQYETLIEPLTDAGYRNLLCAKIESVFKNAFTVLEDYNGLKANDAYYKKQLEERQQEFDDARQELEDKNKKLKEFINNKI